ncbi:prominin-1 isoform X2 [Tribolium madens]|uniref:prominin-1 isoform X2 n=1 Tax=Tribolium madens TaxID=41895 RepID=UPI001CF75A55|nr:prominin-1 isoform X2 [Tribolium madens]
MLVLVLIFKFCVFSTKSEQLKNSDLAIPKTDCIRTLLRLHKQPLLPTNCCLTKLCPYKNSSDDMKSKFFHKLCDEKVYLSKEQSHGCIFENNLNRRVNNDTNSTSNKEKSAIANCSANFQTATINGETALINSGITEESKKRSAGKSISSTLGSPFAQAANSRIRDKKIRFENITKISARISGLQFLDVPKGEEMRIRNLRLEGEHLLFEVFSNLMEYLQLSEFPTDLVRDVFQKRIPFHLVAFQLLKLEFATLLWIIFWTVLTLCIPFMTLFYFCCTKRNIHRLTEDASDISLDFRDKCVERALAALLIFFLTLELFPIVLIFLGNEQISRQMSHSESTTNLIFDDFDTFLRNTHMQMTFVATTSTDAAIEAVRKDLEDLEELLGRRFQQELAVETGIDTALDTLDELITANDEVTSLVSALLEECHLAEVAKKLLQDRLKDISRQLTITRQQCRPKDRLLCYTLQYTGLDVSFSCSNLTTDLKIKQLERMEKEKKFQKNVENVRDAFRLVPQRVSTETASHVAGDTNESGIVHLRPFNYLFRVLLITKQFYFAEIKSLLSKRRSEIYKSTDSLDELSRSLSNSIRNTQRETLRIVETVNRWELWRWLSVLGISTMVALVWGILLCGAPCGNTTTSRTIPLLVSGVIFTTLICFVIWGMGISAFLLGTHGQCLLCHPLYDEPQYKTLSLVLNQGGILKEGVFKALQPNYSLHIEDVLKNCQRNQPAYITFHLQNHFNTNSVTNYKSWDDFTRVISNFTIPTSSVEILSPSLQLNLQFLASILSLNLTQYRTKISGPLTKRDLNSFADQLNTVARQLTDPTSSKRIDNLAFTVRKIIHNETARLKQLRDELLYKITALEILIHPLSQQANRSLAHLRDIQLFMDTQGALIAERITKQFLLRLENYLEELSNYTTTKVTKEIGRCRPLWEIFQTMRFSICKLIVNPTNGISVSCFLLILLSLGIVPVVLNLVEHYRDLNEELLTSITHRRTRDGVRIDEEGLWATPSSETPPDGEMRNGQNEPSTWITPRQSSEPLLPPLPKARSPKRLATIASRISAARVPQIPSISRARSPKRGRHESFKLIEPICWKSGSLSPRSWL